MHDSHGASRRNVRGTAALVVACASALAACGDGAAPAPAVPASGAGGKSPATPGFVEAAAESGIAFMMEFLPGEQGENFKTNLYDHGCGVSVADVDGDGDDDIYFMNQLGPNALYLNDGKGRFTDASARSGATLADRICVSATFGDYDADGDQDVYVTSTRGGNALLRNDGTGRFEDVTAAAGLTLVRHSQGAAFLDHDGDGDLDLYVSNTAQWTLSSKDPTNTYYEGPVELFDLVDSPIEHNVLYRNDGGTFTDVTKAAGVEGVGWGGDIAVFDADGDGDLDMFVANMFGRSRLWRNEGNGTFTECGKETLGKTSWGAVGARVFDHDVDGRLDLFVVDMHSDMWIPYGTQQALIEERRKYPGPEGAIRLSEEETRQRRTKLRADVGEVVFGSTLHRNLGGGKFEEVSDKAGVETFWPWGAAVADFDLNGGEDVYLPSGMGLPYGYWRSSLLMNRGDGTFEDRSTRDGIEPRPGGAFLEKPIKGQKAPKSSRAAAVADFDGDGRPDLVVGNFNERAYYYRNQFPQRHWVSFRLKGTRGHPDAVGALITLKAGGRTMVRQIDTATGYIAQSSRAAHFGLGDADRIESAEIRWPGGQVQKLAGDDLRVDQVHRITEPK